MSSSGDGTEEVRGGNDKEKKTHIVTLTLHTSEETDTHTAQTC